MRQIIVIKRVGDSLLCGGNGKDINAAVFVARDYIHSFEKDCCSAGVCCAHAKCIRLAVVLLLNMALRAF